MHDKETKVATFQSPAFNNPNELQLVEFLGEESIWFPERKKKKSSPSLKEIFSGSFQGRGELHRSLLLPPSFSTLAHDTHSIHLPAVLSSSTSA